MVRGGNMHYDGRHSINIFMLFVVILVTVVVEASQQENSLNSTSCDLKLVFATGDACGPAVYNGRRCVSQHAKFLVQQNTSLQRVCNAQPWLSVPPNNNVTLAHIELVRTAESLRSPLWLGFIGDSFTRLNYYAFIEALVFDDSQAIDPRFQHNPMQIYHNSHVWCCERRTCRYYIREIDFNASVPAKLAAIISERPKTTLCLTWELVSTTAELAAAVAEYNITLLSYLVVNSGLHQIQYGWDYGKDAYKAGLDATFEMLANTLTARDRPLQVIYLLTTTFMHVERKLFPGDNDDAQLTSWARIARDMNRIVKHSMLLHNLEAYAKLVQFRTIDAPALAGQTSSYNATKFMMANDPHFCRGFYYSLVEVELEIFMRNGISLDASFT